MKILALILTMFLTVHKAPAAGPDQLYGIGVSFNSICCGAPADDFLKSFAKKFNKRNGVKLTADIIAGCGREGEYVVLFQTQKLKPAVRKKFIVELQKIVPQQSALNKKTDTSSGTLNVLHNVKASSYGHCRIKSVKWLY